MDGSCHTWMSHVTCMSRSTLIYESCRTHGRVIAHMDESCHTWMSHVTHGQVMSHSCTQVTVPYKENRLVMFDSALFHKTDDFTFKKGIYIHAYDLLYAYTYTCIHTHIDMYPSMHTYTCIYTDIDMYLRMHAYTWITPIWIYTYLCMHIHEYTHI